MLHFIYRIRDKKTGKVGYIGITHNPNKRLRQHLIEKSSNEEKNAWFQSVDPDMDILEIIKDDRIQALEREHYWINKYLSEGHSLVNVSKIHAPQPEKKRSIHHEIPSRVEDGWVIEFYHANEAMLLLGLPSGTFYRKVREGEIPFEGERRSLRFPKMAIDALVNISRKKGIYAAISRR